MKLTKLRLRQIIKEELEKTGPVMQFQVLKTNTGEFRAASNRRDQRLGGYRIEQLEQHSEKSRWAKSVLGALELLAKETNFPVMEWRDIHYFPSSKKIKHFRRGLPYIS